MTEHDNTPLIYRKLVRDRIPEIIKSTGKRPFVTSISGEELHDAIGSKALEEAFELYSEWRKNSPEGVLKESADMLEIIKAMLSRSGYTLDDLLKMMEKRSRERGAFEQGLFLESVDGPCPEGLEDGKSDSSSTQILTNSLLDFIKSELAWIPMLVY
jgi:predicted house-cleaning noncanonical NTP pyrophosphatase (MazG superfamily)